MNVQNTRPRILVAEDEMHIRQYVTDILATLPDVDLVCVPSGEAALEAIKRERWDVIITDQRMGTMDGIAVLRSAASLQPHAQRAMMTGFTEIALLTRAKNEGGVHRFLSKPFSPQELLREIGALIENARRDSHHHAAFERAIATFEINLT